MKDYDCGFRISECGMRTPKIEKGRFTMKSELDVKVVMSKDALQISKSEQKIFLRLQW